jgi:hypothetical protein
VRGAFRALLAGGLAVLLENGRFSDFAMKTVTPAASALHTSKNRILNPAFLKGTPFPSRHID